MRENAQGDVLNDAPLVFLLSSSYLLAAVMDAFQVEVEEVSSCLHASHLANPLIVAKEARTSS